MSDTIACSNCGTEVPSAAAFCTGCGQALGAAAAAAPPPPPPPVDETRVETPGLNDATQVAPTPPPPPPPAAAAAPFAPTSPGAPGAPGAPWGPSPTDPPSGPPTGPPTAAPWTPPEATAPPSWQQPAPPAAPPGAPSAYPAPGAPPAGAPGWETPGAPAWGATAAEAPAAKTGGSVLGGIVGLIGSVLAVVGIFSGWVKLGNTGTVTAWSLTAGDGLLKTQTPYVIVALAGAAGIVSLVLFTGIARTPARILAILLGIAIIGVTAANWAEIASFVTDNFPSSFKANTAIGFYLTIAGGVLVIVSALLPAAKKK